MSQNQKRIVIFTPQDVGFWADVFHGLGRFAATKPDWAFEFEFWLDIRIALKRFDRNRPDGLIIDPVPRAVVPALNRLGVPYITATEQWGGDSPRVSLDDDAIGDMAAHYLMERGYRYYAFCGYRRVPYSIRRGARFLAAVKAAGFCGRRCLCNTNASAYVSDNRLLSDWLDALPRPAAVFACHDKMGLRILQLCKSLNIRVPEELAVLGVDDNSLYCDLAVPPLSSIDPGAMKLGYELGMALDRMITGRNRNPKPVHVEPVGVVTRRSTSAIAIDSPLVARAVEFIYRNAHKAIEVRDVLDEVPISRRKLELETRRIMNCSPRDLITRVHLERAKDLLARTDLDMARIAKQAGFLHPAQLSAVFKRHTGISPTTYRKKSRTDMYQ